MPWLSPSIKLIETFLESKRNEPLPSLLPSPIFLSVPLSFYIPPIYIPLSLSVCLFFSSFHPPLSLSLLCLWINLLFRLHSAIHSLDRSPSSFISLQLSFLPPHYEFLSGCAIRPSLFTRLFLLSPPRSHTPSQQQPPYRKPDVDASVASLRYSGVLLLSIRIAACFPIEISRGNFLRIFGGWGWEWALSPELSWLIRGVYTRARTYTYMDRERGTSSRARRSRSVKGLSLTILRLLAEVS